MKNADFRRLYIFSLASKYISPNVETHPEFGIAMAEARAAGVDVIFIECKVFEDKLVHF